MPVLSTKCVTRSISISMSYYLFLWLVQILVGYEHLEIITEELMKDSVHNMSKENGAHLMNVAIKASSPNKAPDTK